MDSQQNPFSGTATVVSPIEQLLWVCVCSCSLQLSEKGDTKHKGDTKQGEAALSSVCNAWGAQRRALADPINPEGIQSCDK